MKVGTKPVTTPDARWDWAAIERNLKILAEWLGSKQPPGTRSPSHLSAGYAHLGDGLIMHAVGGSDGNDHTGAPGIFWGRDRTHFGRSSAVIVFEQKKTTTYSHGTLGEDGVYHQTEQEYADMMEWMDLPEEPPFSQGEIDRLRDLINASGVKVNDDWNGVGYRSVSFQLRTEDTSPSLRAAGGRYHEWRPEKNKNRQKQMEKFVRPALVPVAMEIFSTGASLTNNDSNLLAIKRAMIVMRPLLEELGFTAQVMSAGRRGVIEGPDSDLSFVEEAGNGVLFPAELAETLVEMAMLGYAVGKD